MMASSSTLFTLEGKGLKLDSAADIEAHIADLRANDVEEVRLLGNTLGVEACKVLSEVLATKKNLKVWSPFPKARLWFGDKFGPREDTLQLASEC